MYRIRFSYTNSMDGETTAVSYVKKKGIVAALQLLIDNSEGPVTVNITPYYGNPEK